MSFAVKDAIKAVVPYRAYAPAQAAFRYLTSLRHAGGSLKCPFCEGNFSRFLPVGIDLPVLREKEVIGAGYRLNAACPRCRSEDRERLVYLYLKAARADVFSKEVLLLHVAPEPSLSAKLQASANINYVSADLDSPLAKVQMDITDIKEKESTYDVIICNHVLEHIEDDAKAMRELYRVLKPGGFAILQVPISNLMEKTYEDFSVKDPKERESMFGQIDHVRLYGRDYSTRLERAAFRVTTAGPADFLEPQLIADYRLLADEKLFVCEKM
ncbi:MAG: methyltransferase domain-containing protein [Pyrinomonadaceae bacterium]|nr:methyltransferase domain-containing protein [Pyrinomonadaceae bacterium]